MPILLAPAPDRREDPPQVLPAGLPPHLEPPPTGAATHVREAQEVERLRLAPAPGGPLHGEAPELQEPRLRRVQLQPELRQPVGQRPLEGLSVVSVLEADDHIIRVPHQHHLAPQRPAHAVLGPEVEHVVEIDVGQQRADDAPLRGAGLGGNDHTPLHNPGA